MANFNWETLQEYLNNQPIKVVKSVEFLGEGKYKNLQYCDEIEKNSLNNRQYHKQELNNDGYEEMVRMYLLTKLVNELGYKAEDIEIEREFKSGSSSSGNDYLDICVYKPRTKTEIYLGIELKRPKVYEEEKEYAIQNQLFKLAGMAEQEHPKVKINNLVYYTAIVDNNTIEKCEIINFSKIGSYQEYVKSVNSGIRYEGVIPFQYNIVKNCLYGNVSSSFNNLIPLPNIIDAEASKRLATSLHNLLWGGGASGDRDIFNSLTRLMLAKIYDEEATGTNEEYKFQIRTFTSEDGEVFAESDEALYLRLNELYKNAVRERMFIDETSEKVIKDEFRNKLKQCVKILQSYSFSKSKEADDGVDILGQFFETIINKDFKQDKGQFFTPIEIVKFAINGLKIDELTIKTFNERGMLPFVIDASCGSGTFLIEYMKYVSEILKLNFHNKRDNLPTNRRNKLDEYIGVSGDRNSWAQKYIYGTEISTDLGTAVKVNMILHGDGASNIFCGNDKGDGLAPFRTYIKPNGDTSELNHSINKSIYPYELNERFDVILSNPPFSVKLSEKTQENIKNNFELEYKDNNSEVVFIERYYQLLKPKGRMAIVLPENCFDNISCLPLRLFLLKYFNIKGIVSLPINTFEPFTATKISILFAQKKTDEEIEKWNNLEHQIETENPKLNQVEIYKRISQELNSEIKMVWVDDVGYKKTKKTTLRRPNELFDKSDKNNIVFTNTTTETAFKAIREINWEN